MGTSCTIEIEGLNGVKIYKHWDGYEEEVLPILDRVVDRFKNDRGWDPEYMLARILAEFIIEDNEHYRNVGIEPDGTTGYGIITVPYDVNYRYIIKEDWSIVVE